MPGRKPGQGQRWGGGAWQRGAEKSEPALYAGDEGGRGDGAGGQAAKSAEGRLAAYPSLVVPPLRSEANLVDVSADVVGVAKWEGRAAPGVAHAGAELGRKVERMGAVAKDAVLAGPLARFGV